MGKLSGLARNSGTWMNLTIIGIQFPVCIVIGYLWGRWMDGLFGTQPYLTAIFSGFGIIAGFRNLFWIVGEAEKLEQRAGTDAASNPPESSETSPSDRSQGAG